MKEVLTLIGIGPATETVARALGTDRQLVLADLQVASHAYCTGFGLPLNAGSGVKVTLPVVGSTFHSPSPATLSSLTGWLVAESSVDRKSVV